MPGNMNIFFHPKMLPEIFNIAMSNMKAREEIKEINRLAKEQGISPKYTIMPEPAKWSKEAHERQTKNML